MEIFDDIRKKFVALTPEEWVRQNFISFLVKQKKYPAALFAIEKSLSLNKMQKRSDVVIYNNRGEALMIIECKAPSVRIDQHVFDQVARYNIAFKVSYLVVTNGLQHYCCSIDHENENYYFLKEIPGYKDITEQE